MATMEQPIRHQNNSGRDQGLRRARALLLAVGYIALWVGLWFATNEFNLATGVSLWYPPAGMTLALLLELGASGLALSIAASLLAGLLIWPWSQWPYYLIANFIPPLGYAIAAYALKASLREQQYGKWSFNDPQQVAIFLGAAAGGALFATLTGSQILQSAGLLPEHSSSSWAFFLNGWLGDLIGALTIAPLILLFAAPLARRFYAGKRLRFFRSLSSSTDPPSMRLVVFQTLLSAQLLIALFWVPRSFGNSQPVPFITLLLLPVLAWIVASYSMRGAVLTVFLYELGIVAMVILFGQTQSLFQYQIVMAVVAASGLLAGAVSHARLVNLARFRDLAEVSNDWLWEFDVNGRLCNLGGRFAQFAQLDRGWLSASWRDYVISQRQDTDLIALKTALQQQKPFQQLVLRIRLPGQERSVWTLNSGLPLFDEDGDFSGYRGATTDITDRKQAEILLRDYDRVLEAKVAERTRILAESSRRAWQLANFDSLTGLPNRNLLFEHLLRGLQQAHRQRRRLALLLLDLDGFKPVNDTFGHDVGDQLLRQIAERLQQCVRAADTVARLGGDEFVIILPDLEEGQSAAIVARKISAAVAEPVSIGNITVKVTVSIGVALHYPDQPIDMNRALSLLKRADQAMYAAKRAGKNIWRFAEAVENPNQDDAPPRQLAN